MSGCQEATGDLVCVVSEKRTVEEVTSRHNAPQRRGQTPFVIIPYVCVSVCVYGV